MARKGVAAEERIEDVAEAEHVARPRGTDAGAGARLAKEVVLPAPLGIAQHLVGDRDLLETLLGLGIGVGVGVVLAGQLPIGAFDLLVGRRPRDAQHLVAVASHDSGGFIALAS